MCFEQPPQLRSPACVCPTSPAWGRGSRRRCTSRPTPSGASSSDASLTKWLAGIKIVQLKQQRISTMLALKWLCGRHKWRNYNLWVTATTPRSKTRKIEADGTRQQHQGLNVIEIETQKMSLTSKEVLFPKQDQELGHPQTAPWKKSNCRQVLEFLLTLDRS